MLRSWIAGMFSCVIMLTLLPATQSDSVRDVKLHLSELSGGLALAVCQVKACCICAHRRATLLHHNVEATSGYKLQFFPS